MKNIICFLTVKPSKEFYSFTKTLKNKDYDVYIVIDTNGYMIPDYDGYVPIIEVTNYNCEIRGFKNTLYYSNNKACARDKALYYFSVSRIQFKHLWLIEEDVFIPNTSIIPSIDAKYPDGDLLCKDNKIISNVKQTYEWHWPKTKPFLLLQFPWACSLICAIRISPKLLGCIANYAKMYSTLFLDEALFNTIAIHNRLSIHKIDELSRLEYDKKWNISEISDKYIYHPIKNFQDQQFLRQYIANNANNANNANSANTSSDPSISGFLENSVNSNTNYTNTTSDTNGFETVTSLENRFTMFSDSNQTDTTKSSAIKSQNSNAVEIGFNAPPFGVSPHGTSNLEIRKLELQLAKAIETREVIERDIAMIKAKLSTMS